MALTTDDIRAITATLREVDRARECMVCRQPKGDGLGGIVVRPEDGSIDVICASCWPGLEEEYGRTRPTD